MAKCSFLPQQPRVSGSQQRADQAMADGDSLKRSSSSSQAALSLLFSLEPGDIAEVTTTAAETAAVADHDFHACADALRVPAEAELQHA
jgi:hypothetical protein